MECPRIAQSRHYNAADLDKRCKQARFRVGGIRIAETRPTLDYLALSSGRSVGSVRDLALRAFAAGRTAPRGGE